MHILVDHSWTYAVCENCRKNMHKEVKMIKASCWDVEIWVCPNCGATKRF